MPGSRLSARVSSLILLTSLTTGCGGLPFFRSNVETTGARAILSDRETAYRRTGENPFEKVDLALELSPDGGTDREIGVGKDSDAIELTRHRIRLATLKFYADPIEQVQRRNRVQERLLAASVQRCGEYKKFLKQLEGETNWLLGSITTAAAGVGAIVTGVNAARAFAGIAAIFSGVRAEFNESLFQRLTIQVITEGFESRRRAAYEKIQLRQREPLATYPVEAAIKEALEYHASCSLIAGLEHAALSIERAENPGLETAERALVRAKRLQAIANDRFDDPLLLSTGLPRLVTAATGSGIGSETGSPRDAYASRVAAIVRTGEKFRTRLTELMAEKELLANKGPEVLLLTKLIGHGERFTAAELESQFKKRALDHDQKLRLIETDLLLMKEDAPERTAKREELLRAIEEGKKIVADIDAVYLTFQLRMAEARRAIDERKLSADSAITLIRGQLVSYAAWILERRAGRVNEAVKALPAGDAKLAEIGKVVGIAAGATGDAVAIAGKLNEGLKKVRDWKDTTWTAATKFPGDELHDDILARIEGILRK